MNHSFKIVNLPVSGKYLSLNKSKFNFKLFLLIFLFSFISKLQMGQCTFSLPPVVCKTALLNLMAFAGPQPGTFTGTGVVNILGTYYFDAATATPGGPYTITYSFTFPFSCSTSSNIRVVDNLTITPLGSGSPLKYTMTSGTSINLSVLDASDHSNFHWYENGFEVGTGSTLFSVQRMGTYTCIADGPCGTPEKAELEVVCDCSYAIYPQNATMYANSYTFTPAMGLLGVSTLSGIGTHTSTDFVFGGTIIIQKGAELDIFNANIDMKACTEIILEAGDGSTTGGKLKVSLNSRLRGCDKWQGIIVMGNASHDRGGKWHGHLTLGDDNAFVSDAYIGVYSHNGGEIDIHYTEFSNNNTDIALMGYSSFDYNSSLFNDNVFKGKWMHDDIDQYCTLDAEYDEFINSTYRSTYGNSDLKQMIYLENVNDFNIYNCSFIGNDFLSGNNYITNAIELNHVEKVNLGGSLSGPVYNYINFTGFFNSGIYGSYVSNYGMVAGTPYYAHNSNYMFDRYFFDASTVLDKAIVLDNCNKIYLGYIQASPWDANQFLGIMNYGNYVTNSDNMFQYENIFNVGSVASTTGVGSTIGTAMYYNNCDNLEVTGTWMADIDIGGYFQDCNSGGYIHTNKIYGANNGFHFKDCDDITIQGNTFDGTSNYAMQYYGLGGTKSYIDGNLFLNATSGYGLIISPEQDPIGTGSSSNDNSTAMSIDITCNLFQNNAYGIIGSGDINTQGNGSYTNGNKFDGNSTWDLCWMDFDSYPSWFSWYHSASTGSEPNATVSHPNFTINASSISYATVNFVPAPFKNNPACFSNFLIANPDRNIKPYTNEPKISNNIVSNEIKINSINTNSTATNIVCYDALGRIYDLELISFENGIYKFNTKDLAAGVYFISINNVPLKFYKLQ